MIRRNIEGRKFFFGIGINVYQDDKLSDLKNAVKDVNDIKALLTTYYDFDSEDTKIINDFDASHDNIINALQEYSKKLNESDSLLIYYAGHGTDDAWLPYDAHSERVARNVSNVVILQYIREKIKAKHILLVSDSCFAGSLFRKVENHATNLAANELEKKPSRWIFASGGSKQPVIDGPEGQNSPFAAAILHILKHNAEQKIKIQGLASDVIDRIGSQYQMPRANAIAGVPLTYEGQFVFTLVKPTLESLTKYVEEIEHQINKNEAQISALSEEKAHFEAEKRKIKLDYENILISKKDEYEKAVKNLKDITDLKLINQNSFQAAIIKFVGGILSGLLVGVFFSFLYFNNSTQIGVLVNNNNFESQKCLYNLGADLDSIGLSFYDKWQFYDKLQTSSDRINREKYYKYVKEYLKAKQELKNTFSKNRKDYSDIKNDSILIHDKINNMNSWK